MEKVSNRVGGKQIIIWKREYDGIKQYCENKGRPISAVVSLLIEQYLKKEKFKPELVEATKVEPIQQSEDAIDF